MQLCMQCVYNFIVILKSSSAYNEPANGAIRDLLHSRYLGVLYFLNIRFHGSRVSVILTAETCRQEQPRCN